MAGKIDKMMEQLGREEVDVLKQQCIVGKSTVEGEMSMRSRQLVRDSRTGFGESSRSVVAAAGEQLGTIEEQQAGNQRQTGPMWSGLADPASVGPSAIIIHLLPRP